MYKLVRNFLFLFPPEAVHHFSMNMLKLVCKIGLLKKIIRSAYSKENPALQKKFLGLSFKNPVGLAAGFDKNALYLTELEMLGFGFLEIGTVTPLPQAGNEPPRLFRLKKDLALVNRMGFNNDGAAVIAGRLKSWKEKNSRSKLLIGGNIGKNKITPNEEAWKDYEICFLALFESVDYFVVNVSSPNTPGLRELQEKESLRKILAHLQELNQKESHRTNKTPRPLLLKIAPDLNGQQIDDVIDLAQEIHLDGLVASNTTISRENLQTPKETIDRIGAGGLSGLPLQKRSTEIIRYVSQKANKQLPIIGSGGIFSGEDAKEKLLAGASLVQVWTGFIYEGPAIVRKILSKI
jgi:dihydroorotate dehydrogenase